MQTCVDVEMENGVWAATCVVVETDYVVAEKEIAYDAVRGFVVGAVIGSHDDASQKATFLSPLMTGHDLFPWVTWIDHDPSLLETVTDHDLCPVATWICHDPSYGVTVIWTCHGFSRLTSSWLVAVVVGPWAVVVVIYCARTQKLIDYHSFVCKASQLWVVSLYSRLHQP